MTGLLLTLLRLIELASVAVPAATLALLVTVGATAPDATSIAIVGAGCLAVGAMSMLLGAHRRVSALLADVLGVGTDASKLCRATVPHTPVNEF